MHDLYTPFPILCPTMHILVRDRALQTRPFILTQHILTSFYIWQGQVARTTSRIHHLLPTSSSIYTNILIELNE